MGDAVLIGQREVLTRNVSRDFSRSPSPCSSAADGLHSGEKKNATFAASVGRFKCSMNASNSTSDESAPNQRSSSKGKVKKGLSSNVDVMSLLNKLAHDLPAFANGLEKLQSDVCNLTQRVDQLQRSAS